MNISICCIAYNRIDSIKRLLASLEQAYYGRYNPVLLLSIDKSESDVVENFAKEYEWKYGEKRIVTHQQNMGLRKHVLECGTHLKDFDAMVVLEDDITVSPFFFQYTLQCVAKYSNDDRIAGISLYSFPVSYQTRLPFAPVKSEFDVFMMNCAQSWGQVWMKKQWKQFEEWYADNSTDFDDPRLPMAINSWPKSSWLKYHTRYCIEKNKFFVYPYEALSTNNNDIGTHVKEVGLNIFQSTLQLLEKKEYRLPNFDECFVKYDGYFEPLFLDKYLGIDKGQLCVDIFGQKNSCLYRRFLLSRKSLPYHVVKSFALDLKPIEANVVYAKKGYRLFLYDTTTWAKCHQGDFDSFLEYVWGFSLMDFLHNYGLQNIGKKLFSIFCIKVKKHL